MSNKLTITVPTPCHEDWDKMTDAAKGKFCGSCQKEVIDFSGMSEAQLVAFFKKPVGSVCGRFRNDQVDAEMTIPAKRIPWAKYFFQVTLPAFLFALKSNAQTAPPKIVVNNVSSNNVTEPRIVLGMPVRKPAEVTLTGKIIDSQGRPVPFASVMIKGTSKGVSSDAEGSYKISAASGSSVTLVVSAVGYYSLEQKVTNGTDVVLQLQMSFTGEVVVVRNKKKKDKSYNGASVAKKISDSLANKIDTLFSRLTVYPNPATRNSVVFADVKKMQKGNYNFSIKNISGQEINSEAVFLDGYIKRKQIDVNNLTAGIYVVNFQNIKTGKLYSEKLIVE